VPTGLNLQDPTNGSSHTSPARSAQTLETIPGTPNLPMSLSRSPSPRPGGGWASPGLNSPFASLSGRSSPAKSYRGANGGASSVTWESAKAKTEGVNGYPSFSTQNNGFFNRHYRNISNSLPSFNMGPEKSYAEKEKLGRGRWMARDGGRIARLRSMARRVSRKAKIRFLLVIAFIVMVILFYTTRKITTNRTLSPILTFGSFTLLLA
jgi:mannan polymerase II complex MNN10 subunit